MERRVAIIGQAQTAYSRRMAGLHLEEIVHRTVRAALRDAGLGIADIDTVVGAGCDTLDGRSISNVFVAEAEGAFLKDETKVEEDGAYAAYYALMRLLSGAFDTALVVAYSKGSESSLHSYSAMISDPFYQRPLGLDMTSAAALHASAFSQKYGVTAEQAASVVVKSRRNAALNPYAQERAPLTVEEVLAEPMACSPLHAPEMAPCGDGACVLVLACDERAERAANPPVWIKGVGQANDAYYIGHRESLADIPSASFAARKAYEMAGISDPSKDLDFAEIYELTSYGELALCGAMDLCQPADAGALSAAGHTALGADLPINPSGGTLAAHALLAAGLARLAEASLQISGRAGERQVKDARVGLVHSCCGLAFQSNLVFVLGR
jgi:acetyl-CoA C-acetyltransferase